MKQLTALKNKLENIKFNPRDLIKGERVVFVPGLMFLLLGAAVIAAPALIIFLFAALFLFLGAMLCFVAWRMLQLKRKVEDTLKNFESRIVIQGVAMRPQAETEVEFEGKKIVFH